MALLRTECLSLPGAILVSSIVVAIGPPADAGASAVLIRTKPNLFVRESNSGSRVEPAGYDPPPA